VRQVTREETRAADAAAALEEAQRSERLHTAASLAGAVDRGMAEAEKLRVRLRSRSLPLRQSALSRVAVF